MEEGFFKEGDHEKQRNVWTAATHIVFAVVGSGVLALAWSFAQMGWVVGPLVVLSFSSVASYTSALLADCYRYPDPITGTVNHSYMDAVQAYLEMDCLLLRGIWHRSSKNWFLLDGDDEEVRSKPPRLPTTFFIFMEEFKDKYKEKYPKKKKVSVVNGNTLALGLFWI